LPSPLPPVITPITPGFVFNRRKEEAGSMGSWLIWTRRPSWTSGVLMLGLGLRLYHFLRDPSLWHDEAALVLNVLDKGFLDLLGPLSFAEAAPPLLLWIERAATLLLGNGTYALRLFPLLASCAALLIMLPVAQRMLRPPAVPWALLLLACSDHLLWHSCEAKPYAVDVFAATVLLAVFCWTASWELGCRLMMCGLLGPVLIFLAYPGCFLCGGLLVALLPAVWRARRTNTWLGYGLLVLAIFAAFAVLVAGPIRAQRCETIVACWKSTFPRWDRPWTVPIWTVLGLLEVFRYCFEPIGQILLPLAVVGAATFWQRGSRALLALLLVPIVLALLAACLQAYPFGGYRVMVYAAPALALLVAEGLPLEVGAERGARSALPLCLPRSALRVLCRYGVLALALLPLAWAVHRVCHPWNRADCAGAARYVLAHSRPGDSVAANHWEYAYYFRRLGLDFSLLPEASPAWRGRLWLVTTAGTPADRLEVLQHFRRQGWQSLEQHEFTRTSVFLLSRVCKESRSD
jgi:hypothetical protein